MEANLPLESPPVSGHGEREAPCRRPRQARREGSPARPMHVVRECDPERCAASARPPSCTGRPRSPGSRVNLATRDRQRDVRRGRPAGRDRSSPSRGRRCVRFRSRGVRAGRRTRDPETFEELEVRVCRPGLLRAALAEEDRQRRDPDLGGLDLTEVPDVELHAAPSSAVAAAPSKWKVDRALYTRPAEARELALEASTARWAGRCGSACRRRHARRTSRCRRAPR